MKNRTVSTLRANSVALASAIAFAASAGAQSVVIFEDDFNAYSTGNLSGQGGWVMTGTHSPQIHSGIAGTDGSPLVGPAAGGASGVIAANNVQGSPFGLGPSLNEVTLEFDIIQKSSGGIYAFGIGHTSTSAPAYVSILSGRFEVRGEGFGTQNPSVDAAGDPLMVVQDNLYRVRSIWDVSANGGAGSANLFVQNMTAGDPGFTQVFFSDGAGGVTDEVSLEIGTDISEWDRAWTRVGASSQLTYIDDVMVTAIPEPSHFAAFLGLGTIALLWIRRRRAS